MSQYIGEFSSQNNSLYTWHNLIVGFKVFISLTPSFIKIYLTVWGISGIIEGNKKRHPTLIRMPSFDILILLKKFAYDESLLRLPKLV
jgi:hypothetical protein